MEARLGRNFESVSRAFFRRQSDRREAESFEGSAGREHFSRMLSRVPSVNSPCPEAITIYLRCITFRSMIAGKRESGLKMRRAERDMI